jgi:hypothetical protein
MQALGNNQPAQRGEDGMNVVPFPAAASNDVSLPCRTNPYATRRPPVFPGSAHTSLDKDVTTHPWWPQPKPKYGQEEDHAIFAALWLSSEDSRLQGCSG